MTATTANGSGFTRWLRPHTPPAAPLPKCRSYRVLKAGLHTLAAEIELAPASESGCVNTEDFNEAGACTSNSPTRRPAEAERGLAELKTLAGGLRSHARRFERLLWAEATGAEGSAAAAPKNISYSAQLRTSPLGCPIAGRVHNQPKARGF